MTNKQIAEELAGCNSCRNHKQGYCDSTEICVKDTDRVVILLERMAELKDGQIKDKIEQFFSEHDDYDYQVSFMDDYTDMDRLKNDLISFMGL